MQIGERILSNFKEEIKFRGNLGGSVMKNSQILKKKHNAPQNITYSSINRLPSPEPDFYTLIQNEKYKLINSRISLKEYFYSIPKCDICDLTGINNDEIKKFTNQQFVKDTLIFDYILFQCSICKVNVHRQCGYEINSFPSINYKERETIINLTWACDLCKKNGQSDKRIDNCQICLKSIGQLKKPHLMRKKEDELWVHNWCLIWFDIASLSDPSEPMAKRLKQLPLTKNSNCFSICYKCNDQNTKYLIFLLRIMTLKCSYESCTKFFHPICIRETLFHFNICNIDGKIAAVCYCEDHSQKILIKNYIPI